MSLLNPAKERMKAGGVALGLSVRLARSPDIARIAKSTGHDFLFIDGQHSIFNLETIAGIAHTALEIGVAPIVRVRSVEDPDVSLLLDNGVTGIVFPDVNTVADARKAVARTRFAPLGGRSVSGGYPHFNFASVPLSQSVPQLDECCLVACMIETLEGMQNLDDIAKVEGIDVLHLGSNDLLAAMGKPGRFDDPDLAAAQERLIRVARANGKYAGCGGNRDLERQVKAIRQGCQFVTTQTDIGFLSAAAGQWVRGIREALK